MGACEELSPKRCFSGYNILAVITSTFTSPTNGRWRSPAAAASPKPSRFSHSPITVNESAVTERFGRVHRRARFLLSEENAGQKFSTIQTLLSPVVISRAPCFPSGDGTT